MTDEEAGRARDFVGYGRTPPDPRWPNSAHAAVNVVINDEEGGEYAVPDGDEASEAALHDVRDRPRPRTQSRSLCRHARSQVGCRGTRPALGDSRQSRQGRRARAHPAGNRKYNGHHRHAARRAVHALCTVDAGEIVAARRGVRVRQRCLRRRASILGEGGRAGSSSYPIPSSTPMCVSAVRG